MPLKYAKTKPLLLSFDHPEAKPTRPVFVGTSGERVVDDVKSMRDALRGLRWTHAYFASLIGVHTDRIRQWVRAKRIPDRALIALYRGQQMALEKEKRDAYQVSWSEVPSVASLDGGIDRRFPDASTMAARVARRSGGHAASLVRACQMLADMADTADRAESVRVFFRSLR